LKFLSYRGTLVGRLGDAMGVHPAGKRHFLIARAGDDRAKALMGHGGKGYCRNATLGGIPTGAFVAQALPD
jgi:hypothetical protein